MSGARNLESGNRKPNIAHARKLARKLVKDTGLDSPPIELRSIVKQLKTTYEVDIDAVDFGDAVSGIQVTEGNKSFSVGYNQSQHVHRQRFTVAHEIGHFLLGHTREASPDKQPPEEIIEKEANEFASELLMPLEMLKTDFKNGISDMKMLATRYWVSDEAMYLRIMNGKLLNKIK